MKAVSQSVLSSLTWQTTITSQSCICICTKNLFRL